MSTPSPQTYLVTGGTGFLGQTLVRRLLSAGHNVRVLARSKDMGLINQGAQWHQGSILDRHLLSQATQDGDGVFHLAGRVDHTRRDGFEPFRRLHVEGTLAVLEAALLQNARVVYASTCGTVAVSRDPAFIANEDTPYQRDTVAPWPYHSTKVEAEEAALDFANRKGLELITMRPSLLLGPGDTRLSSSRTLVDFVARKIPFVPEGGLNVVDVRDVAAAFDLGMTLGRPGATYLVGARNMTLAALFDQLQRLTGVPAPKLKIPYKAAHAATRSATWGLGLIGRYDPGLDPVLVELAHHHWYLDSSAARHDLGWTTRPTEETLKDALEWLAQHHPQKKS
mgnify:CR=1 FL=1